MQLNQQQAEPVVKTSRRMWENEFQKDELKAIIAALILRQNIEFAEITEEEMRIARQFEVSAVYGPDRKSVSISTRAFY